MKWFDNWFAKKCRQAWDNSRNEKRGLIDITEVSPNSSHGRINSHGMNFTIHRADGGYIIEQRTFQKKTEHYDNHLHIVTDDKDLGQELAKIITFTNLRT